MDIKAIIIIVILDLLIGAIPGMIAARNGKNFFVWWIYGALLLPIALPHALILSTRLVIGTRKCGYCRANVRIDLPHCPRCGYEFIDFS